MSGMLHVRGVTQSERRHIGAAPHHGKGGGLHVMSVTFQGCYTVRASPERRRTASRQGEGCYTARASPERRRAESRRRPEWETRRASERR
eukprot:9473097-Pyramimonas_sp.AAC.1